MFRGRSKHNLDSKGRLAIPARFKESLEANGEDCLVVTNHDTGPRDKWRVIEEKAATLPQFDRAANNYLRYFISGAVECHLKNGRITLPPDLREIAGLKKEVVLVGELIKFEIWEKDKWEEEFQRSRESFSEVSDSLTELGI
ncbi:MAG: division/cell wall cluster transcriptional repressor MraZ [Deltaproteobacteria bacterium]|nr:division/cell wall cluster transcriptional repressor MraZ [Deltaproteobacteria bacterium]